MPINLIIMGFTILFSLLITVYAVKLSIPEVGSSKNIRIGSDIRANAIAALFFSPVEIPLTSEPPIRVS